MCLSFTSFFSVSCLPQSFDYTMPSFLSHYWVNDVTIGALLKWFALISVGRVQTPIS